MKKDKVLLFPVLIAILELGAELSSIIFPPNTPSLITQPILETFVTIVFIGPLSEELIYRGVLIGGIGIIFLFIYAIFCNLSLNSRGNNFPTLTEIDQKKCLIKYRLFDFLLLLFSSWWFAINHLSMWGYQTLPYYFIKGVIYGFLFLRYGFISSLLMHITFNFFSLLFININLPDIVSIPIFILIYLIYTIGWEFTSITLFNRNIYQRIWSNLTLFNWLLLLLLWLFLALSFSTLGFFEEPTEISSPSWIPIVIFLYYAYIVFDGVLYKILDGLHQRLHDL